MHLTTIVSLLAVGAAAAPAARSLHLNSKVAQPTLSKVDLHSPTGLADAPKVTKLVRREEDGEDETTKGSSSSTSSSAGLVPGLPSLPIRRRQDPAPAEDPSFRSATAEQDSKDAAEAEETPLDAYLDTFDGEGEYDEEASEKALDRYHESLDKDESNSTTSAITTSTSVAPAAKTIAPVEAKNETSTEHSDVKNVTSSAAPVSNSTEEIDFEKLDSKTEAPKNETLTEDATKKNETEPEPTKKADPLARLSGLLPVKRAELPDLSAIPSITKRQDLPELPKIPSADSVTSQIKRQLEDGTEAVPKVDEEDVAATDVEQEEITTPTVDKNATVAVNETAVNASSTADAGYYNVNKHMAKLDKLPIGGLPVKRQASELPSTPVDAPEVADSQSTSGLPTESRTSYQSTKADSPLHKFLVPLQRQHEEPTSDLTAPSESSEEELAAVPAVESQQKPEKRATVTKTTEEVSPDTDDVEAPAVADSTVPDTGLNGLLGGLA